MKNQIYKFIGIIALSSSLHASDEVSSKVEIGQGFRNDSLKFSISGSHKKPDIISELDFRHLHTYLSTLKASLFNKTYLGEIDIAYGKICSGTHQDSDYDYNHRKGELSRSISHVPGNYSVDAAAKVGRIFHLPLGMTLTPCLGYGSFWQKLQITHGKQIIVPPHAHRDRINAMLKHLNDTRSAHWSAPFAECVFSIPLSTTFSAELGYTFFYPIRYKGKGHWKLRHMHVTLSDSPSKSFGQKGSVGLHWALSDRLQVGAMCSLTHFQAKGGHIHFHFREPNHIRPQPGHKMSRLCTDYTLTLSYAF